MSPHAGATSNSSSSACGVYGSGFEHGKSPAPYLFGGLAVILGLLGMALLILVCYCEISAPNSAGSDDVDARQKSHHLRMQPLEMEPKIVVIMAGDDNPTYLANPVACICRSHQQL